MTNLWALQTQEQQEAMTTLHQADGDGIFALILIHVDGATQQPIQSLLSTLSYPLAHLTSLLHSRAQLQHLSHQALIAATFSLFEGKHVSIHDADDHQIAGDVLVGHDFGKTQHSSRLAGTVSGDSDASVHVTASQPPSKGATSPTEDPPRPAPKQACTPLADSDHPASASVSIADHGAASQPPAQQQVGDEHQLAAEDTALVPAQDCMQAADHAHHASAEAASLRGTHASGAQKVRAAIVQDTKDEKLPKQSQARGRQPEALASSSAVTGIQTGSLKALAGLTPMPIHGAGAELAQEKSGLQTLQVPNSAVNLPPPSSPRTAGKQAVGALHNPKSESDQTKAAAAEPLLGKAAALDADSGPIQSRVPDRHSAPGQMRTAPHLRSAHGLRLPPSATVDAAVPPTRGKRADGRQAAQSPTAALLLSGKPASTDPALGSAATEQPAATQPTSAEARQTASAIRGLIEDQPAAGQSAPMKQEASEAPTADGAPQGHSPALQVQSDKINPSKAPTAAKPQPNASTASSAAEASVQGKQKQKRTYRQPEADKQVEPEPRGPGKRLNRQASQHSQHRSNNSSSNQRPAGQQGHTADPKSQSGTQLSSPALPLSSAHAVSLLTSPLVL